MSTWRKEWLGGLLACSFAAAAAPPLADLSVYTQAQRLVEVEPGRRLNLVCLGEGSPTVLFESGLAEPTSTWFKVQPVIATQTRSCSYDRAGTGFSDAPTGDGSSAQVVEDLKRLLVAAQVGPPYVLVGHSYGGMNARLYYYTHPREVVGMVLVDPTHEDQGEGYRMLSPRGLTREAWVALGAASLANRRECAERAAHGFERGDEWHGKCVFDAPAQMPAVLQQAYLDMQQKPPFHRAQLTEEESVSGASVAQLREARRSFVDLPVIVLTQAPDSSPLRDWETAALRTARTRFWARLHQGLADGSSRGVHRVVPGSDHSIQLTQPDAVVGAIREMLSLVAKSPGGGAPKETPVDAGKKVRTGGR